MGQKQLDSTAHDGHLVVTATLADTLRRDGLSGFEVRPVRRPHLSAPDPAYRWLHVVSEWPPMAPTMEFAIDDLCPRCHRTGHFDADGRIRPWRYDSRPAGAPDIGCTWERFGYWRSKGWEPGLRGVGGQAGIIVSARARSLLIKMKVRHLDYVPLVFERS
jgi:hypothetical protein